jgi:putative heme iron utilization protein
MKTRLQIYIKKNTNYTLRTIATQHNVSIGEAVDILIENYKSNLNSDKLAEQIADVVLKRLEERRAEEVE